MYPFIEETAGPAAPRHALSRWMRALGLFHAIGCASGFTFFLI